MAYITDRDEIFPTSSMCNFSNGPSLMQSYTKVPCSCITISTSITYGTVPCVTLQTVFSYCTVSTYTRYNCEFENQVFTNDPLPIQIGQEYFMELFKCKFQEGGSYNLRSNTSCGHGLCWCWPGLTVEHASFRYQEYPECSGFQAGAKDLFTSFGICPMNQSVYIECGVFVFIFS